jgi:DNA-binding winged helix-turn-helix (wHTH) protein
MRVDFGEVVVDTRSREITRRGQPVPLSPKAFELLLILLESRPQAVSKAALQDRLWPDTYVVEKNLTNLVAEIRQALGDPAAAPQFLRTVPRFGYALREDPAAPPREAARHAPERAAVRVRWPEGQAVLPDGEHVIGRAPDAAIRLDAESVSRRHARITVTGARVVIEDLGSKNGTVVGARRITEPTDVVDGERIRVGQVVLEVRLGPGADSTRTVTSHSASFRSPP